MYHYDEMKSEIGIDETSVECPIRGCRRRVARQRERFLTEDRFRCPEHRITISPSTFAYDRVEDNLLRRDEDDLALLAKIRRVKRESRMARENSEDAVTWNLFRSLEKFGALGMLADRLFGSAGAERPRVAYWSCCPETYRPWSPLIGAVSGFGERPGRHTEPDLVLLYEDLVVFVEAKLGASNATTPSDSANAKSYMTGHGEWFRQVFQEDSCFRSVAVEARLYELMRLWLIGTRIAHESGRRFLLVNLVRSKDPREADIEGRFGHFLLQDDGRQFLRLTWEQIWAEVVAGMPASTEIERLAGYLAGKTLGYARQAKGSRVFGVLRRAFNVQGELVMRI